MCTRVKGIERAGSARREGGGSLAPTQRDAEPARGLRSLVRLAMALSLSCALPNAGSAACTVGGTSALPLPATTHLRSYRAEFDTPSRLAVDAVGNVYVADPGRRQVVVRAPNGRILSRKSDVGRPVSIAVGTDRIYVGDDESGSIRAFDSAWNPLFSVGQGAGELQQPSDLSIDALTGNLYVVDTPAHLIKVYDDGGSFSHSFGGEGSADGQLSFPAGVYVDAAAREVLVADQLNYRIQVFSVEGAFLSCFGAQGSAPGRFNMPQAVLTDNAGRIYVADSMEGRIQVFDRSAAFIGTIGEFGETSGQLRIPVGMVIDPAQRLFIGAANNARLEVYGLDAFSDPESVIPATLRVHPAQVDRAAPPLVFVTYLELPGVPFDQLVQATLIANGVAPDSSAPRVADQNGNGVPDVRVEFDAASLLATLPADGSGNVAVSGLVAGSSFEGSAAVRVTTCAPTTHCPLGAADPQCNEAVCLPEIGCVVRSKGNGIGCEDGHACSVDDVCLAGVCTGELLTCNDRNVCTDDTCDPTNGCVYTENSASCDDGDACTLDDTCAAGTCVGTVLDCDDGDVCTDDGCDSAGGCTGVFNAAPCDDGDACSLDDTCVAGSCSGSPRTCDDGNPCTDDSCDPGSGCRTIANTSVCDDANSCTVLDTCAAGTCSGMTLRCDDGNTCTDDGCNPATGCTHAHNSTPCDDADAGTVADTCNGSGVCEGQAVNDEYAILGGSFAEIRRARLSVGRRALIGGSACAETMLLRPDSEILGDAVARASVGKAIVFQRGNRVSGDVVTGGGSIGLIDQVQVGGRIDRSGAAAELGDCTAALFRASQRRAEILLRTANPGFSLAPLASSAGETLRLPRSGSLDPGVVVIDTENLRLAPGSTLTLAGHPDTEIVIVRIAGRMRVGLAARIETEELPVERVLFVVDGPIFLDRNASVAGSLFTANRLRLGIGSSVRGALIGGSINLSPLATVELHPFIGW